MERAGDDRATCAYMRELAQVNARLETLSFLVAERVPREGITWADVAELRRVGDALRALIGIVRP
ncbi:MAG: hypothetical protein M1274_15705 [Actinobacteria bacterium]|nr:hypothetical protein [Actinomycetota bacterium]